MQWVVLVDHKHQQGPLLDTLLLRVLLVGLLDLALVWVVVALDRNSRFLVVALTSMMMWKGLMVSVNCQLERIC
jgi:hypothetical protein